MKRGIDLLALAAGLVLAIVALFFLVADNPSIGDVGKGLLPIALVVAGITLLAGSLRRG